MVRSPGTWVALLSHSFRLHGSYTGLNYILSIVADRWRRRGPEGRRQGDWIQLRSRGVAFGSKPPAQNFSTTALPMRDQSRRSAPEKISTPLDILQLPAVDRQFVG